MLKRRRTVLCFVHGEVASVVVVVCYDRRTRSALLSRYERSKFATQLVNFWVPCKIGRKFAETASHGAVLCTRGRSKREGCIVL